MSGLSQDARALLDAAHGADDPSEADRDRVHGALTAAIAAGTAGAALAATTSAAASSGTGAASAGTSAAAGAVTAAATVATKAAVVGAGVGITTSTKLAAALLLAGTVGGAIAVAPRMAETDSAPASAAELSTAHDSSSSEARVAMAEDRSIEPAPAYVEVAAVPDVAISEEGPAIPSSRGRLRVATTPANDAEDRVREGGLEEAPADRLLGELSLLRRASEAARAGQPDRALTLLSRHRSLYPDGELSAERQAATVLALCDSGRSEEARATAERFLRRYRTSPLRERVRRACALTPGEELRSAD